MSAIISDKFRIYNAEAFLDALGDDYFDLDGNFIGNNDPLIERNQMYFFVGRPQSWEPTLEVYGRVDAAAGWAGSVGDQVSVGTPGVDFTADVVAVYEDVLVLGNVSGSSGNLTTPPAGSTLTVQAGGAAAGSTATTGVYRFADEDTTVPTAFDNTREFYEVYDDIIAAKRMTVEYTRAVVRRYNWALTGTDVYDMYRHDYSFAGAPNTGTIGKPGSNAVTDRGQPLPQEDNLGDMKFYVMNGDYEVWKCLYNGSSEANPNGIAATIEPTRNPSLPAIYRDPVNGEREQGLFCENVAPSGPLSVAAPGPVQFREANGYVWKFMYKLPIDDVLRFLSTDFMPVSLQVPNNGSDRLQTEQIAQDGAILSVYLRSAQSAGLPVGGPYFAPVVGDGTGAVVSFEVDGTNNIINLAIAADGTGYTYGSVILETGTTTPEPNGVFDSWNDPETGGDGFATATGTVIGAGGGDGADIEVIIAPKGGHGAGASSTPVAGARSIEREFNAKRIMANIRLTYAEGDGDFPVDNDFRRIVILKDPTTSLAVGDAETLSNLKVIRVSPSAAGFQPDDDISQVLAGGGTAKGKVVSVETLSPSGDELLSYYQSQVEHKDRGVVREFDNGVTAVNPVTTPSNQSNESGTVVNFDGTEGAIVLVAGVRDTEFNPNTGDILYQENRRLITRAPDQIEDIKLVIEF